MAHQYFAEHVDRATADVVLEITGDEARHAVSVARLRTGERVRISNGRGLSCESEVISADPKAVRVCVLDVIEIPAPPALVLVQALAKGGRDEQAVQAATELGATAVVPWEAQRSVSRWSVGKAEKGIARWQTIAREAAKQAMRPWIPEVRALLMEPTALPERNTFVLVPGADTPLVEAATALPATAPLALVVGPEGGISDAEIARWETFGATAVRLGTEVLRASTAGPAAIAAVHAVRGYWGDVKPPAL